MSHPLASPDASRPSAALPRESLTQGILSSAVWRGFERLGGFGKHLLIAAFIGLSAELDAFYLTLPLATLIVGTLGPVTEALLIPCLIERQDSERGPEARRLAAAYYSLALLAGLALAAAIGLCAPALAQCPPGLEAEQRAWFAKGLWMMLPYFALAIPMRAAITLLRVERRFSVTAQGEFLVMAGALAALVAQPRLGGILFISASIGMGLAWLYLTWQAGRTFRLWGNPLYPPLWRELHQAPALAALKGLQHVQSLLLVLALASLSPGALGAYQYAYALVFVLPAVLNLNSGFTTEYSERVSRHEPTGPLLRRILGAGFGLGALGACAYWVGGEALARFALERGAFGPEQTRLTSEALRVLALALPVWLTWGVLETVFQVRRRYRFVLTRALLGLGVTAVGLFGALHAGANVSGLCAVFVLSLYAMTGWALWGVLRIETESAAEAKGPPPAPAIDLPPKQ